jgi:hypothetical protein
MTRDDWLVCGDPVHLLDFLDDRVTDRKLRLFACAWGRDVWRHLSDERSREAILAGERFADGEATFAELIAAHRAATDAERATPLTGGRHRDGTRRRTGKRSSGKAAARVARHAADPVWNALTAARAVAWHEGATRYALSNHLRDIFNPFRTAPFDTAWRTSTVLALGRCAYDSGDFSALPILADALQDAGCEDEEVLIHCRQPGTHVRGCWVVDLVLGRE